MEWGEKMANMIASINPSSGPSGAGSVTVAPTVAPKSSKPDSAISQSAKSNASSELTNVRAVSEDGDTLQIFNESGSSREITSFVGISDMRLEQLYLKGDISHYDYMTEMEDREELRDYRMEEEAKISNEMTGLDGVEDDRENAEITEKYAYEADNPNSTENQKDILDAMQDVRDGVGDEGALPDFKVSIF